MLKLNDDACLLIVVFGLKNMMEKSKKQQQYDLVTSLWSIGVGCVVFLADNYARNSGIAWIHGNSIVPMSVLMFFGLLLLPVELIRFILYLLVKTKRPKLLNRLWAVWGGGFIVYMVLSLI